MILDPVNFDPVRQKGLEIILAGMDDLNAVAKLQIGLATGAVAFFVRASFEPSSKAFAFFLTLASIPFGLSAVWLLRTIIALGVLISLVFLNWHLFRH